MQPFAFTPNERVFLEALNESGVRYMLVGMGAAVLQGVPASTNDLDLWFENRDDVSERLDVILHMSGLGTFAEEWQNTRELVVDGLSLRLLLLPRIVASKRASGRPKDVAAIPILEVALAAIEDDESRKG
jgi:hypothetical protein